MRKNAQNGGFVQLIVMIIILVFLVVYLKDNSTVNYFWSSFISNMQRIHDGKPNDWQLAAPTVIFK